jgi:phosphoglycolate phosphatase
MKQLVIFDLDGTLLNTIDDLGNATNYALQQCGYPTHMISTYPYFVGNGINKLIERALPQDDRSQSNVMTLRRYFLEYYDKHCCDDTKSYHGIPELLQELTERGINLAVASNKYQSAVEQLIKHFFPNYNWVAVEGQKTDVPTKPDPSIVFEILNTCPTPKDNVLYVGDSGVDMETARRACIESVGVTWGFRPEKELRENYADHIISDPDDILSLI